MIRFSSPFRSSFQGDTKGSVEKINKWVAEKTKDKIQDIVNEQVITPDSRLVLVNALYFNGFWESRFNKFATQRAPFFLNEKDTTEVDTMANTDTYKYYECSKLNAKFLELGYEGGDVSMTVVLPNEKNGLAALEARLPEVFEDRNFTYERVNVRLPKFTIESTIQFKPILENVSFLLGRCCVFFSRRGAVIFLKKIENFGVHNLQIFESFLLFFFDFHFPI